MKTIKHYLSILPYPINDNALSNYKGTGFGYCANMKIALILAFNWSKTKEGYKYWDDIFNYRFENHTRQRPALKAKKDDVIKIKKVTKKPKPVVNKIELKKEIMTRGCGKHKTYNSINDALDELFNKKS